MWIIRTPWVSREHVELLHAESVARRECGIEWRGLTMQDPLSSPVLTIASIAELLHHPTDDRANWIESRDRPKRRPTLIRLNDEADLIVENNHEFASRAKARCALAELAATYVEQCPAGLLQWSLLAIYCWKPLLAAAAVGGLVTQTGTGSTGQRAAGRARRLGGLFEESLVDQVYPHDFYPTFTDLTNDLKAIFSGVALGLPAWFASEIRSAAESPSLR